MGLPGQATARANGVSGKKLCLPLLETCHYFSCGAVALWNLVLLKCTTGLVWKCTGLMGGLRWWRSPEGEMCCAAGFLSWKLWSLHGITGCGSLGLLEFKVARRACLPRQSLCFVSSPNYSSLQGCLQWFNFHVGWCLSVTPTFFLSLAETHFF